MFMLSAIECAILLVLLGLIVAAIKYRHWALLGSGIALCGAAVLAGVYAMNVAEHRRIVNSRAAVAEMRRVVELERLRLDSDQWSTTKFSPSSRLSAEVVSEDELASIASAPPKIKLDSETVIDNDSKSVDAKSDRPIWIDAELNDNQKLITAGPFADSSSCKNDTRMQINEWLWSRHPEAFPLGDDIHPSFLGIDPSNFIKSQYAETRDTSVGEVHLLYTLVEVIPEVEAQIAKSLAEAAAQIAQRRSVRAVSFAGAGVLSLVALTHVVLRSGGRRAKSTAT